MSNILDNAPLGKQSQYVTTYSPDLLFAIPRATQRESLKLVSFSGCDIWTAFELSWLNQKGKPQTAIGEFIIPADSENLIESKSLKLYLNSLNQTKFLSMQDVAETIGKDLAKTSKAEVKVSLFPVMRTTVSNLQGDCLDEMDIEIDTYDYCPSLLQTREEKVEETLYSNLFKSNCLITGQPDWAAISISYQGRQIDHPSLLRYLVSFRNHQGFHEHCTEMVYLDLLQRCNPDSLTVTTSFTRRGGVSIGCIRSSSGIAGSSLIRTVRQ